MQSLIRAGVDFTLSLISKTNLEQTPMQREHPLHHALLTSTLKNFFANNRTFLFRSHLLLFIQIFVHQNDATPGMRDGISRSQDEASQMTLLQRKFDY